MNADGLRLAEALIAGSARGMLIPTPSGAISVEDAYQIQHAIFRRRQMSIAGWKLAVTSPGAQQAFGIPCPIVGRLAASDIVRAGHEVGSPPGPLYAEAEIAVTLGADLPPRSEPYAAGDVAAAICDLHAAIELCTSRYEDDDVAAAPLIADNALAHRLVLGDRLADGWDTRFAATTVTLERTGELPVGGSTSAVMGNPLVALTWLANWLSARGEGLRRGQLVATGSCTGITQVQPGDALRASFAGAGKVEIAIAPRNAERRTG